MQLPTPGMSGGGAGIFVSALASGREGGGTGISTGCVVSATISTARGI